MFGLEFLDKINPLSTPQTDDAVVKKGTGAEDTGAEGEQEATQQSDEDDSPGFFGKLIPDVGLGDVFKVEESEDVALRRELAQLEEECANLEQELAPVERRCSSKEALIGGLEKRRDQLLLERRGLHCRMLEGDAWRLLGGGKPEDSQPQSSLARAAAALVAAHQGSGTALVEENLAWENEDKILQQVAMLEASLHRIAACTLAGER
jgi:hypothetical protein